MMMKKVPFNLDYFKTHHPMLETREGKKARIVAIDAKGDFPIVALVLWFEHTEFPFDYTIDGYHNYEKENINDLFMLIH